MEAKKCIKCKIKYSPKWVHKIFKSEEDKICIPCNLEKEIENEMKEEEKQYLENN